MGFGDAGEVLAAEFRQYRLYGASRAVAVRTQDSARFEHSEVGGWRCAP